MKPALSGLAFFASALLGLVLSRTTDGIAAVWPANGVLMAALLLSPPGERWRYLVSGMAAGVLANAMGGTSFGLSTVFAASNIVSVSVVMTLLTPRARHGAAFADPASITRFFVASAAGVVSGATVACSALWLASDRFIAPWLSWSASDLLGMILITPLIVTCAARARELRVEGPRMLNGGRVWPLVAVLVVSVLVFQQSRYPMLFVPLAVVMIATYRLGLLGAVAGTIIVAVVGSLSMTTGHSPLTLLAGSTALRVQFFQFYLATVYGTSMPLAALLAERGRLASARADSDRRHRRIIDRSRAVIFETDCTGLWTYLNPAWETMTGRPVQDSIGQTLMVILDEAACASALECLEPLYRQERHECHQDIRYRHTDGRELWASLRCHLLADEHGVVTGTYGTMHDISARVAAQVAQLESDRRYRLLADHSNDMIVQFGLTGVRQYVSPASVALLGFSPEELVGQPAAGAIHPDDRATVLATCRTLLEGADNPICSYRQLHKNGVYVWLEASYRLIRNDVTGEPEGFIASVRDINRRTKAELDRTRSAAQLEEANRLLLMAEDMSGVGHWRVDVASGMVYWSDMVCAIHGRPHGYSPTVDTAIDAYHPDDRAAIQAVVDEATATGSSYAHRAKIIRTDGAVRQVVFTGRAERGPDGSVNELFGVFQDVTDAFEAQQALVVASDRVASSNRMLMMAEAVASLGHWRIDHVAGTLFWSEETYRIFGIAPSVTPTIEATLASYHPEDVDRIRALVQGGLVSEGSYTARSRIIRPDGCERHILTRGDVEYGADGAPVGVFGIVQDITEQVEAEALRVAQAQHYHLISEQASDLIALTDASGICHFVSPSSRTVLGYEPAEMIGRTAYDYAPKEDYPLLAAQAHQLATSPAGTVAGIRFRMRRKTGEYVWMDVAARIASFGESARIVSVGRDITAQVKVEEELRRSQVKAQAAVAAKSSFLANMSHEIRTPMNGVIGFAELLLDGKLDDTERRQAELIAESGRAMMRLLNDILDLSKVEAGHVTVASEPFELVHALKACVALVAPAIERKGVALQCEFAADLPKVVVGDALRVRQIVLNLLGNAAKFTLGGTITLSAALGDDGRLMIAVEDTGIGIEPDRQRAIFEQFTQADDRIASRFGGTGLGLAISNQLAMLMGGELSLNSKPGRGSRFTFSLPLPSAQPCLMGPAVAVNSPTPATVGGSARILVAEDHDVNRLLISAMLEKLCCKPDFAHDGREAVTMVAAAAASGDPYALVFMDMQMPNMNGVEATRHIRASGLDASRLPIVALTANAFADDVAACLDAGMQAHVAKPFSLSSLQDALDRWLPAQANAPAPAETDITVLFQQRYRDAKARTLHCLDQLVRAGTFTDMELTEVGTMLHQLAGTAAMFGEAALGEEAGRIEAALAAAPGAERDRAVRRAVTALQRAA